MGASFPLHKFLLKASYATHLERVRERDRLRNKETDVARFDEVYGIVHDKDFKEFSTIETDNLDLEAVEDCIIAETTRDT